MLKNFLLVGLGGMIGSLLRYAANVIIKSPAFPLATLLVNILGSFIIAIVLGIAIKNESFNNNWRLFLATGICGGFTTFSSFSAECIALLQEQRYQTFLLYTSVTLLAGLGAAVLGFWVVK